MISQFTFFVILFFSIGLFFVSDAGTQEKTWTEKPGPVGEEAATVAPEEKSAPAQPIEEPTTAPVQVLNPLSVKDAVFCKSVERLTPVATGSSFSSDVGRVFFFTRIIGAEGQRKVTHRWLKDGTEMASIPLSIGPVSWRTYSSKSIEPSWMGSWSVEVLDENGKLLGAYNMMVVEAQEEVVGVGVEVEVPAPAPEIEEAEAEAAEVNVDVDLDIEGENEDDLLPDF